MLSSAVKKIEAVTSLIMLTHRYVLEMNFILKSLVNLNFVDDVDGDCIVISFNFLIVRNCLILHHNGRQSENGANSVPFFFTQSHPVGLPNKQKSCQILKQILCVKSTRQL